ncbi:beta-aspartyl-peptidase [Marinobacteraceae bacterium S3BR75-40.1]
MAESSNALLKVSGGELYAPQPQGKQTLMVTGDRLARIGDDCNTGALPVDTLDASGCVVVPGFVDGLAHIIGGGGEGGFATRTPEMRTEDAIRGGVTTLMGALGTDAVTQTLPALLAKARALESDGLTCFCYTGSYQVPVRTVTGGVQDDIVLIDRFVGVGEVAISDHRSSHPSREELTRLAAEARVGGMLAGKAGIVFIHTGDAPSHFDPLLDVANHSAIPLTQFWPTHANRSAEVFSAAIDYARQGGLIDFTASTTPELIADGDVPCVEALPRALKAKVPLERITFTSDGHASLPRFDGEGRFVGLQVGQMTSLLDAVRDCVLEAGLALEEALTPVTANPARILKMPRKGRLEPGSDADLLVLEKDSLKLRHVVARGRVKMRDGEILHRGYFA